VVEAISVAPVSPVSPVAPASPASPVAPVSPVAPASPVAPVASGAPMEGQDANTLIASRLGVEPGDVTAKLVALSQQNVLNGAADGRVDDVDDDGATVNVSLTLEDLEKFERYEEATAAEKQAVVLKMRPAVLGATPTRPPSAVPVVAAAAATPAAPAAPAVS
jgi:hypothetical protein